VLIAMDAICEDFPQRSIQRRINEIAEEIKGSASDDEVCLSRYIRQLYTDAITMLTEYGTLKHMSNEWNRLDKIREQHMRRKILAAKPSMVIVGDAHASALRISLPDYLYVSHA
jgi:hypothetical protein